MTDGWHEQDSSGPLGRSPVVTVVTPSFRSRKTLARCVDAVIAQETSRHFELVVVHSGDEEVHEAVQNDRRLTVLDLGKRPLSPATKRNAAARRSSSDWLAFVDADCVPAEDWLEELISAAEANNVSGIGGSIGVEPTADTDAWVMHVLEFGQWLPDVPPGPTRGFPSCNAAYRRQAFRAVGGFAEEPGIPEDLLLNLELLKRGHNLRYESAARVVHVETAGTSELLDKSVRLGRDYGCLARGSHEIPAKRLHSRKYVPVLVLVRLARFVLRAFRLRGSVSDIVRACRASPIAVKYLTAWARAFVS